MIDYTVAYRLEMGTFFAQALGFPEVSAIATSLSEARINLLSALRQAAERKLRRGEFLPQPEPPTGMGDAYLIERVRVAPDGEHSVGVAVVPSC
jgi:hypothetical protein